MAQHKVPQDVETADKLVGFLSLKQFLFVLAGCGLGFIAFNFAKVNIFLGIPFLPPIIVFFVLGLYQRKDQPVEVFLAAWLRFKLNPKTRIWNQEGYEQRVIVTAPKKEVIDYTKGLSKSDVYNRFSGLSSTLDTRGWSAKGVRSADSTTTIQSEGESTEERLLSLDDLKTLKRAHDGATEQSTDIFDANNYPVATQIESQVDHQAVQVSQEAGAILDSQQSPTSTGTLQPHFTRDQRSEINKLATSDAPISTIATQAEGTIDLDQGAVFKLR